MKTIMLFSILIMGFYAQETGQQKNSNSYEIITTGLVEANKVKASITNAGYILKNLKEGNNLQIPHPDKYYNPAHTGAIYDSGIWLSGKINGIEKAAIASIGFNTDFSPGIIDSVDNDGKIFYQDPKDPIFKIYYYYSDRYLKELNNTFNSSSSTIIEYTKRNLDNLNENGDWETAVSQGAPEFPPGDVAAYCVFHDADSTTQNSAHYENQKEHLNVQIQQLVWSFMSENLILDNTIFTQINIINKNQSPIDSLYFALFNDSQLGSFGNDITGSDAKQKFSYFYERYNNSDENFNYLNLAPPAIGISYLKGFSNNGSIMKASSLIEDNADIYRNPDKAIHYFNQMKGKTYDGSDFYQREDAISTGLTNEEDSYFFYNGNPETEEGWLYPTGQSGGVYHLYNIGPIDLGVYEDSNGNGKADQGDAGFNSVTVAFFTAFGENNLNSVTLLKDYDLYLKEFAKNGYELDNALPKPDIQVFLEDTKIILDLAKNTDLESFSNSYGFEFEGYQIAQFEDSTFSEYNSFIFKTMDLVNNRKGFSFAHIDHLLKEYDIFSLKSQDTGLEKQISIEKDYLQNTDLENGKTYYYGVRAFASKAEYQPALNRNIILSGWTFLSSRPNKQFSEFNLSNIRAWPNPYKFNETNGIKQIQFNHLPKSCTIKIFDRNGLLVKKIIKNDALDYLNWDLTNTQSTAVVNGLYIAEIQANKQNKYIKIAILN